MSWIFVDGISEDALYEALDLAPANGMIDQSYLGSISVPLAGAVLKSGWCGVFAKCALVMDLTLGTKPPRLTRLPAKSRCVACLISEYAMVSYAGLWENGRHTWEIRHDSSQGLEHLELSGDLPQEFEPLREAALEIQRTTNARRKPQVTDKKELSPEFKRRADDLARAGFKLTKIDPSEMLVDCVINVPLDMATAITGYEYCSWVESDFFRSLRILQPAEGNVLEKLGGQPKWWQTMPNIENEIFGVGIDRAGENPGVQEKCSK
jgi:hypothetical protein